MKKVVVNKKKREMRTNPWKMKTEVINQKEEKMKLSQKWRKMN